MRTQTEREAIVRILHELQQVRSTHAQEHAHLPVGASGDLDPLAIARTEAVVGWVQQRQPQAARQRLEDHAEALSSPYAIALLMAMLAAPEAADIEAELRWRRDLLLHARQNGIALAWQVMAGPDVT